MIHQQLTNDKRRNEKSALLNFMGKKLCKKGLISHADSQVIQAFMRIFGVIDNTKKTIDYLYVTTW